MPSSRATSCQLDYVIASVSDRIGLLAQPAVDEVPVEHTPQPWAGIVQRDQAVRVGLQMSGEIPQRVLGVSMIRGRLRNRPFNRVICPCYQDCRGIRSSSRRIRRECEFVHKSGVPHVAAASMGR